jgi:hypothetical protein
MMDHIPYRRLLRANGYALKDLAEKCGVSEVTAGRWLLWLTYRNTDGRAPPLTKIVDIMDMCHSSDYTKGQVWAHICTGFLSGHLPKKDARGD